jgi:hypothetical protein
MNGEEREAKPRPRRIHGPRRTGKQPQTSRRRAGETALIDTSFSDPTVTVVTAHPESERKPNPGQGKGKGGTVTPMASPNQIQNQSSPLPPLPASIDSALQLTASALRCPSLTPESLPHPLLLLPLACRATLHKPPASPSLLPRHFTPPSLQIDSALASAEQQRQGGGSSIQQQQPLPPFV